MRMERREARGWKWCNTLAREPNEPGHALISAKRSLHRLRVRSCTSFIFLRFYDIHRNPRYPADNGRVGGVSHGLGMPF